MADQPEEPKPGFFSSFWGWLTRAHRDPVAAVAEQVTAAVAEALKTAPLACFQYHDGEKEVWADPAWILLRLGELAQEIAFTAHSPDTREGVRFDPQQVLDGFCWVFDMKYKSPPQVSHWNCWSDANNYWTGECVSIDEMAESRRPTAVDVLKVVERFFTEYEDELRRATTEAEERFARVLAVNKQIEAQENFERVLDAVEDKNWLRKKEFPDYGQPISSRPARKEV